MRFDDGFYQRMGHIGDERWSKWTLAIGRLNWKA